MSLSQLTQALGKEFPPAVGVVHLGTPGSIFHPDLWPVQVDSSPRENGRLVHAS